MGVRRGSSGGLWGQWSLKGWVFGSRTELKAKLGDVSSVGLNLSSAFKVCALGDFLSFPSTVSSSANSDESYSLGVVMRLEIL